MPGEHPLRLAHQVLEAHPALALGAGRRPRKPTMLRWLTSQISSASWRREKGCGRRKKIWSSLASSKEWIIPCGWRTRWM